MTCTYCESDTADQDTYVVYGGLIWCDLTCLAEWFVDHEHRFNSERKMEIIEERHEVIEQ